MVSLPRFQALVSNLEFSATDAHFSLPDYVGRIKQLATGTTAQKHLLAPLITIQAVFLAATTTLYYLTEAGIQFMACALQSDRTNLFLRPYTELTKAAQCVKIVLTLSLVALAGMVSPDKFFPFLPDTLSRFQRLTDEKERIEQQLTSLTQSLDQVNREKKELQDRFQATEAGAQDRAAVQLREKEAQLAELSRTVETQKAAHEQVLAHLNGQVQQLETTLRDKESLIGQLLQTQNLSKETADQTKVKQEKLEAENRSLQSQFEVSIREAEGFKAEAKVAKEEKVRLQSVIDDLQERNAAQKEKESEIQLMRDTIRDLEESLTKTTAEKERLLGVLTSRIVPKDDDIIRSGTFQREIETLRARIKELEESQRVAEVTRSVTQRKEKKKT